MAKTFTRDQLQTRYDTLPQILQDALFEPDVSEKIYDLCQKHGILGERIPAAAAEIGNIILGLTTPNEFVAQITEILSLKEDTARVFAKEIYIAVLRPIENDIKRTHGFDLSENMFDAKPAPAALQAEPQKPAPVLPQAATQKPAPLVIPPRPVVQQTPPTPRPTPPPPPLRPAVSPPQPIPPLSPSIPKPTIPSPLSQAPVKPPDIPRRTPASPPPAPPPTLPPEQIEPRPPFIARSPLTPSIPPRPIAPRESVTTPPPPPKPPTPFEQKPYMPKNTVLPETHSTSPIPPEPVQQKNIFSPQMPGPLQPPQESIRPTPEKSTKPPQPRVFAPVEPKAPPIQNGSGSAIKKEQLKPAPKRPVSPRDLDDPYRETVTPQEKELQQKRDAVSDPRGPKPPFQVRKGEPPYVNPKIPPIDLREDATRPPTPPAPPDPHWEKLT